MSLFLTGRFLFTLLAGEEVAPQLLQPLADPLELGDADACNDPQKMHCKDPPKDTQAPMHMAY